jgi:hypothetical protein
MYDTNVTTDRIFNRFVNEMARLRGLNFVTTDEYKLLEARMKNIIHEELCFLLYGNASQS